MIFKGNFYELLGEEERRARKGTERYEKFLEWYREEAFQEIESLRKEGWRFFLLTPKWVGEKYDDYFDLAMAGLYLFAPQISYDRILAFDNSLFYYDENEKSQDLEFFKVWVASLREEDFVFFPERYISLSLSMRIIEDEDGGAPIEVFPHYLHGVYSEDLRLFPIKERRR